MMNKWEKKYKEFREKERKAAEAYLSKLQRDKEFIVKNIKKVNKWLEKQVNFIEKNVGEDVVITHNNPEYPWGEDKFIFYLVGKQTYTLYVTLQYSLIYQIFNVPNLKKIRDKNFFSKPSIQSLKRLRKEKEEHKENPFLIDALTEVVKSFMGGGA